MNFNEWFSFRWIKDEYNNPEVLITENGWSDNGEMKDVGRIEYLREHLNQLLDFVLKDNGNLKGYTGKHEQMSKKKTRNSF